MHDRRPRRNSTVAICHRPDRAITKEPNLDHSRASKLTTGLSKPNIQAPAAPSSYRSRPEPVPVPREILENIFARRRNRSVVISNLPQNLDIRNVLCRVRGGTLDNCFLSNGPGKGERCAVLTFENLADAENYAEFLKIPREQGIWTVSSNDTTDDVKKVGEVNYQTNPTQFGNVFITDPIGIPLDHGKTIRGATRCLILKACPLIMIEPIFRDLRLLPALLKQRNFRSQVEDIWIDNFTRDNLQGRSAFGDLHIWFTNIHAAIAAVTSVTNRYASSWSAHLLFEDDPCAQDLSTLVAAAGEEQEAYRWHSFGNVSLLALLDHGVLERIFQKWRRVPAVNHFGRTVVKTAAASLADQSSSGEDSQASVEANMNAAFVDLHEHATTNMPQKEEETAMSLAAISSLASLIQWNLASTARPGGVVADLPHHGQDTDESALALTDEESSCETEGFKSEATQGGHVDTQTQLTDAQADIYLIPPPAPTYPMTFLSVLYIAALEALHRSPMAHNISLAFKIPIDAIDFLGDTPYTKTPTKADDTLVDSTPADTSLDSSSETGPSSHSDSVSDHGQDTSSASPPPAPAPMQQPETVSSSSGSHYHPAAKKASWSCDMSEFMAMTDEQWMAFGTVFYLPPPGFKTAKKHVGTVLN